MNIALTHIPAAASALIGGKNAFVRAMVLGAAVACASAPVLAQDRDRDAHRNGQQAPQPRPERMAPQPQRPAEPQHSDPRQYDSRQSDPHQYDVRAEEQRRQAQEQGAARRSSRLTPDERRELRRQINEAGIDLYPNAPRR
jgi:hypothetical protein